MHTSRPLDRLSPVPLYHQLAEVLRYQIATGAIGSGTALPPLREAASQWNVNLHTVRHAYAELAELGYVETRVPHGTVVLRQPAASRTSAAVDRFVARIVHTAAERHGLTSAALCDRIARAALADTRGAEGPVHVIECSESQAEDLAVQIAAAWAVPARPWSLERPGAPPDGTLIATYFHYNEIRQRWPNRFARTRFVVTGIDPDILDHLNSGSDGKPRTLFVCERDHTMAANIVADLHAVFATECFEMIPLVYSDFSTVLRNAKDTDTLLFAPRVWGSLSPAQHNHPAAYQIRYVIRPQDLAAIGLELGWTPQPRSGRGATSVAHYASTRE
ncbi:MAG: GntR family transcriptional regulator [Gemmatimonadaceae bacterium]